MQIRKCPHLDLYFINIKLSGDYDRYTKSDKTYFRCPSFFFQHLGKKRRPCAARNRFYPKSINYNDMINNIS